MVSVLILFLMMATDVSALSVEEAYKAIPHRRTVFDVKKAGMTRAEKDFLVEFYELVDLAIVERVDMLMYLMSQGRNGALASDYDTILEELRQLKAPKKLKEAHRLVILAIEEQRHFLEGWEAKGFKANVSVASDSTVRSASSKLIQAYNIFMQSFQQEGAHNKQAFFDYLCALDFL